MTVTRVVCAMAVSMVCGTGMAGAHHSFAVEYDANKPVTFEGVVTRIEWTNPHARVYVDVAEAGGAVKSWNLELASPSALARNGWSNRTRRAGRTGSRRHCHGELSCCYA